MSAYFDRFYSMLAPSFAGRVVLMTFSEFGRRAKENGAAGTDHGTAGPMLVVGNRVAGGMYGSLPSLTKLDVNGNLAVTVDFRACTPAYSAIGSGPTRPPSSAAATPRSRCSGPARADPPDLGRSGPLGPQQRSADGTGLLAQLGLDDRHRSPVGRPVRLAAVGGADRVQHQLTGPASPPPMTTTSGSSRFSRFETPSATHQPNVAGSPRRLRVALGRGPGDVLAPHGLGVAAGQRHDAVGPPAWAASRASRPSPLPERVALPAAPAAARAGRAVRVDDHVPGLAGEAGGAPLEHALDDEARRRCRCPA